MRSLWTGAALAAVAGALPAAAEICSAESVPEVRYCGVDEFCCGKGCCPRSMLYFFKLSVAVVLIVMILVWLCNYMRRGRSQLHEAPESAGARAQLPPSLLPPPPYAAQARAPAQMRLPYAAQPARPLPQQQQQQPPPPPLPQDDLPPPYHTVVSVPPSTLVPTHLPSYDASCKAMNGPA